MPCYDPTPPAEYEAHYAKEKVDKLTRLLCEAIAIIDNDDQLEDASEELRNWAEEHVLADMDRLVAERDAVIEKAKQKWIKGLAPHEKRLMGL